MTIVPKPVRKKTILAQVMTFNEGGYADRTIFFAPAKVGRSAHLTDHPDHRRLLERVIGYFSLYESVDEHHSDSRPRPETTTNPVKPVLWTNDLKARPEQSWPIILFSYDPKRGGVRTAFIEDDGEFAEEFVAERESKMVEAKEAKAARKPKKEVDPDAPEKIARVLRPKDVTVSQLPIDIKPVNLILPNGEDHEVKVFAKTWREKKEGSKRVRDEETPRVANDDAFTYAATAYQLGKTQAIYHHSQGIIIVGQNGVGILQTIRNSDKDEMEKVLKAAEKHGFKGKVVALPKK